MQRKAPRTGYVESKYTKDGESIQRRSFAIWTGLAASGLGTLDEALCSDGAENSWASKSGTGLTWGFDNGAWNTARMVTPCNVGQALLCFERAAP